MNTADTGFIARLTKIIEANQIDEKFGVNELAAKTGMSRSQIHRKLKSICNKSVSQFMREVRLEKAKELLQEGNQTVSEIAYNVGFNSPSYFIKSFHDYFGYPPGEYLKYAPKEMVNEGDVTLINESIQENKNGKFFIEIFSTTNRKILLVLIAVTMVISGIIIVINKFRNNEMALAVLQVDSTNNQNNNEYLAYGVQAGLIGGLSELKELRIISQKSASAYQDKMISLKDLAKRLNVNLILTAELINAGDSIEIVLNLVDVFQKERNIWTNIYETDLQNIYRFYSSAVVDIAQELKINLSEDANRKLNQTRKVNPESLKAYYRGLNLIGKDDVELFEEGMNYLLEAIDKDPADPFANAAAAIGYALKGHNYGKNPKESFIRAGFFADRALKLDSTIDEAYTAKAMLYLYREWEWDKAKEAFGKAIEINPNNDIAYAHFAWYYEVHNDFEKAIYYAEKAVSLNPLYIAYDAWLAAIYYRAGEYDKAETYAKIVLAERDSSVYANIVLGWINLLEKNYSDAILYTEKLPDWDYWNLYRAYAYYKAGENEKALSYRNALEEKAKTKYALEWHLGLMAAIFSYKDEAFKYFNIAIDKKQYQMMYLNWYPFTESLRNDPRYNELLARMNLPPNNEKQIVANR